MTPEDFADKLVDWVATVTQLDPDKDMLPHVDDWRRNAAKLFSLHAVDILATYADLAAAAREIDAAVPDVETGWARIPAHHIARLRAALDRVDKAERGTT